MGAGLLATNGRAIANLYSGNAKDNIFVYSKLTKIKQLYSELCNTFYAVSYNLVHTITYTLWEIMLEARSRYRQLSKKYPTQAPPPRTLVLLHKGSGGYLSA